MPCEECGKIVHVGDWWKCPHPRANRHRPFVAVEVEGRVIDSIQAADKMERETTAAYRDGRGQPLVMRAFHQDSSNRDRNVFGRQEHIPYKTRNSRGVPFVTRRGDADPSTHTLHPAVKRIIGDED